MGKTVRKPPSRTSKRATSSNRASSRPILSRLIGLETEYAILKSGHSSGRSFQFSEFIEALKKKTPLASSFRNDHRYFLANGGSFSLENGASPDFQHALLEAATAECSSPLQVVESHRALQELARESLRDAYPDDAVCLVQGNHDGHGHTYGQHESYDVTIAKGLYLWGWRLGVSMLLPCVLLYRLLAAVWILLIVMLARTDGLLRIARSSLRNLTAAANRNAQHSRSAPAQPPISTGWLLLCARGLRILHSPLAFFLWCNIQLFALRHYRKAMSSFFASRCILDGAGYVDEHGKFCVSARGPRINAVIGFGGYSSTRPIFRCDNWLRQLCFGSPFSISGFISLLRTRQRVEIALGDSGLCEPSQLLRIGCTALVFDLVDRNPNALLPRLRQPIRAIQNFSNDWMLLAKELDRSDFLWRASEIQNAYASQVRMMLEQSNRVPNESWLILDHWQSTLNHLDLTDDVSEPSRELVGRVDWITKLWLLDQLDKNGTQHARKKLDLRYHELSKEGYGLKVLDAVHCPVLFKRDRLDRARQNPPDGSAAQQRSYYIREFSGEGVTLQLDWHEIRLSVNNRSRVIHISH